MSGTERVVNLGELVGKLQSGTGSMQGYKEDKRNKVTPSESVSVVHNSQHAVVTVVRNSQRSRHCAGRKSGTN